MIIGIFQNTADVNQKNDWDIFKANMNLVAALSEKSCVVSSYPVLSGGVPVSIAMMAFGNEIGVQVNLDLIPKDFDYQGSVILEIDIDQYNKNPVLKEFLQNAENCCILGHTIDRPNLCLTSKELQEEVSLTALKEIYEKPLSKIYPVVSGENKDHSLANFKFDSEQNKSVFKTSKKCKPVVLLPVFPGTNCETEIQRAFSKSGANVKTFIFKNRTNAEIDLSIKEFAKEISACQILALSGGSSSGGEPDGCAKYIVNILRSPVVTEEIQKLIKSNDGLILGIDDGFQALVKVGLLPFGEFKPIDEISISFAVNKIGRHVSKMVKTKLINNNSVWLSLEEPGTIYTVPVSNLEGQLVLQEEQAKILFDKGQVPFCYVDDDGNPTLNEQYNPFGSNYAIEALVSPDGRILGKMAHSQRFGKNVHINVPGNKKQNIFKAAVEYFL
jgi:phosphoribosylformylglycinamidine synthase